MSIDINEVTISGHLTADPEIRYTPGGTAILDFNIGHNERRTDGQDRAHFIGVTAFGAVAEATARFMAKGSGVIVQGRLSQDRWEDQNTGQKRSKTRVVASRVHFIPRPGPAAPAAANSDQS